MKKYLILVKKSRPKIERVLTEASTLQIAIGNALDGLEYDNIELSVESVYELPFMGDEEFDGVDPKNLSIESLRARGATPAPAEVWMPFVEELGYS